jgi:outer membrane protein assembly factor BamB
MTFTTCLWALPVGLALTATACCAAPSMTFEELGAPVRIAGGLGVGMGPDENGKRNTLYIPHNKGGGLMFLVALNLETGRSRQYTSPADMYGAWAVTPGADGRVYIGTCDPQACVLRFDPKTEEFVNLGAPEGETYFWNFAATPDGKLYGGTYPGAKLIEIDTATGKLNDLGRMSDTEMYNRTVLYGKADDTLYCAIGMVDPQIVAYRRDTGKHFRMQFPGSDGSRPDFHEGVDGYVYATQGKLAWRLVKGEARPVESAAAAVAGPLGLWDGRQVISAHPGVVWLVQPGTDLSWKILYTYECVGTDIFVLREGPLGRIYGSSILPLHVFEYVPETRQMTDLERVVNTDGEVYSFSHYQGKLYTAAYTHGTLSVYDPTKPFSMGTTPESNPIDLGHLGNGQDRPQAMKVGFDGSIWIASFPDYGKLGGALNRLTPGTWEKKMWEGLVPDQAPISLAMDEVHKLIWSGTTVGGGGGAVSTAKEAVLFAFDPATAKKVFECVPVPGVGSIQALVMAGNKMLYGAAGDTLFVFDPVQRKVTATLAAPGSVQMDALQNGNDGWVYGMGGESFFRVNPADNSLQVLGSYAGASAGFAVMGRDIYFGKGPILCVGHVVE